MKLFREGDVVHVRATVVDRGQQLQFDASRRIWIDAGIEIAKFEKQVILRGDKGKTRVDGLTRDIDVLAVLGDYAWVKITDITGYPQPFTVDCRYIERTTTAAAVDAIELDADPHKHSDPEFAKLFPEESPAAEAHRTLGLGTSETFNTGTSGPGEIIPVIGPDTYESPPAIPRAPHVEETDEEMPF